METILIAVLGIAVGFAVGYISIKNKLTAEQGRVSVLESENQKLASTNDLQKKHYEELLKFKEDNFKHASEEQEKRHTEAQKMLQSRFDETIEKMSEKLKNTTDEMLKQRQKEFELSSHRNLDEIVNPLKDSIEKMGKAMDENSRQQTEMGGKMKESIANMMRQSMDAQKSTEELTRALKHDTKVQGDWGEVVLDEVLRSQGLEQGKHYDIQAVIYDDKGQVVKNEEGKIMRPDVILHLDGEREVIIDAKTSVSSYIDYVNAENDVEREHYLKAHVESIRKHVKELSAKDYSSYIQSPKVKMDYVIMFVPNTAALWTALNAEPSLWRWAMGQNVYIADEQTLYAAVRIVSLTWMRIDQVKNHEQVFKLANEMINRVGLFLKDYQAIGKALDDAREVYDAGKKKLQPGGKSIITTCKKLEDLGAKQNTAHPINLLDEA